jgi:hypothetical protein
MLNANGSVMMAVFKKIIYDNNDTAIIGKPQKGK